MNVADEATTAHLGIKVFACRTVSEISQQLAIHSINDCFHKWGLPESIKIDNGWPFVNPKNRDQPTKAKLWWAGLGIKIIQNTPRCPQENGAVEALQGIMCNWSNPKGQNSLVELQVRLNQESFFQRAEYRRPAHGYKTRIEQFPELEQNKRKYNPDNFNIQLVYQYLAKQVWTRKVKQKGSIKLFANEIYIGLKNKQQFVFVTLDPIQLKWLIKDRKGNLLNTSTKGIPIEKEIKDFCVMSMNEDTTL